MCGRKDIPKCKLCGEHPVIEVCKNHCVIICVECGIEVNKQTEEDSINIWVKLMNSD